MNPIFRRLLARHQLKHLVEFKRGSKGMCKAAGFVAAFSDRLILLHRLDWDTFRLNGYEVIMADDVSHHRVFDSPKYWQYRAAKLFRHAPKSPKGFLLGSLQDFLKSNLKKNRLVTLHVENTKPDVCYIGPVVSVTEKTVSIEDLNCNAEWSGLRRLRLMDVTKIDFGGGYEEALAKTAPDAAGKYGLNSRTLRMV